MPLPPRSPPASHWTGPAIPDVKSVLEDARQSPGTVPRNGRMWLADEGPAPKTGQRWRRDPRQHPHPWVAGRCRVSKYWQRPSRTPGLGWSGADAAHLDLRGFRVTKPKVDERADSLSNGSRANTLGISLSHRHALSIHCVDTALASFRDHANDPRAVARRQRGRCHVAPCSLLIEREARGQHSFSECPSRHGTFVSSGVLPQVVHGPRLLHSTASDRAGGAVERALSDAHDVERTLRAFASPRRALNHSRLSPSRSARHVCVGSHAAGRRTHEAHGSLRAELIGVERAGFPPVEQEPIARGTDGPAPGSERSDVPGSLCGVRHCGRSPTMRIRQQIHVSARRGRKLPPPIGQGRFQIAPGEIAQDRMMQRMESNRHSCARHRSNVGCRRLGLVNVWQPARELCRTW